MEQRKFVVDKRSIGKRLDIFLSENNNDLTRSFIKKQIESDQVRINDKITFKSNQKLQLGDNVFFVLQNINDVDSPKPENISLNILYEDHNIVAINKDSGMVVHPGSGHFEGTLVNALLYKYENIKSVGKSTRSGLIHRIDKDTSGVILIAKTNKALSYFTGKFANREVEKKYLAVACGELPQELILNKKISIKNFLERNQDNRKKFKVSIKNSGKFAHTDFRLIASEDNLHLIEANLRTGRTHQIRVHLSFIGIPILGDLKYGRQKYKRLMLHSQHIEVENLDGSKLRISAPIPEEFNEIFSKINES